MIQGGKRYKYGLGHGEWDAMLERQGGRCQICGTDQPGGTGWHTDHDHATGAVRALLCLKCNLMLGYADDNRSVLASAIEYLDCWTLPIKALRYGR
jgi:hypothetical protein